MLSDMDKNVGGIERVARLAFGALLILAAGAGLGGFLTVSAAIAVVGLVLGLVLLVTGSVQMCPINEALGIDTYVDGSNES